MGLRNAGLRETQLFVACLNRSKMATGEQTFEFEPRRFLTGRGPGQSRLRPEPGETVCAQGAPDDALFYIEEGWVKISVVSPGGKEAVVAVRGIDNFFGTRSLIDGHRRAAAATALTSCSLVRITRAAAVHLLRTEPDFAEMLATYLALQMQRDEESLADQLIHRSERRLARALMRLADHEGAEKAVIAIRVNQADLASMIGTTRSRVSHFMNRFRRQGFIDYTRQGHVIVHRALLRTLLDH
jgi:CRP/FNR family transcriptional regulator, cyclic AMP receptor protein